MSAAVHPFMWEWSCECGAGGVCKYRVEALTEAEDHEEEGCYQ